ncbi:MAG: hypothetical protein N3A54_03870 [Patescibacteria group bacterium]|nr:hypothetical protein [Patescibacteria group bacterium]
MPIPFKDLKELLLEYTFKEINVLFGDFFNELLPKISDKYKNFNELYDDFEDSLNLFREQYDITESDMKIPSNFIINMYSKLKKHFSTELLLSKQELGNQDDLLFHFVRYFPPLLFIITYFKKYPQRYETFVKETKDNLYASLVKSLVNNYENYTFKEIYNLEKQLRAPNVGFNYIHTVMIDYVLSTFVRSKIKPIYEDNRLVLYKPKNWVESRILGADTEWCISSSNAREHFPAHNVEYFIYFGFYKPVDRTKKYAVLISRDSNKKTTEPINYRYMFDVLKGLKVYYPIILFGDMVSPVLTFMKSVREILSEKKKRGGIIKRKAHSKLASKNILNYIYDPEQFLEFFLIDFYRVYIMFISPKENSNKKIFNSKVANVAYRIFHLKKKGDILRFINGEYVHLDMPEFSPSKIKDGVLGVFDDLIHERIEKQYNGLIFKDYLDEDVLIHDVKDILLAIAKVPEEKDKVEGVLSLLTINNEEAVKEYDNIKFTTFPQLLEAYNRMSAHFQTSHFPSRPGKAAVHPFNSKNFDLDGWDGDLEAISLLDQMTPNDIIINTLEEAIDEEDVLSLIVQIVKENPEYISLRRIMEIQKSEVVVNHPLLAKIYDTMVSTLKKT